MLLEKNQEKINNFDAIRLFLAFCVCFTHSFNLLYGDNTDPLGVATNGAVGLGGTAVDFFFLISGYLVVSSILRARGSVLFLRKRVLRIYPAYIVASFLCVFFFAPMVSLDLGQYFRDVHILKFIKNAIFLGVPSTPGILGDAAFPHVINGSLWTIRYEFLCYIGLAFLYLVGVLRYRWLILLIGLAWLLLFVLQSNADAGCCHSAILSVVPDQLLTYLNNFPRFFTYFTIGTIFYLYREDISHRRSWVLFSLILVGVGVAAHQASLVMPVFGSYVIFYLAYSKTLNLAGVGRYGDFSYGVYLYAFPVQQVMAFYAQEHLNGLTMFLASGMISLVFAVASWHLVEKHFLKMK
ncbi:acyltransferase family protein [Ectopseudomonas khazarica]|uniref:acyltransferase family protein n=1 Tax=Ectopseudomonas khazarica TaxID=2502979 RepID=UPI0037C9279A